MCFTFKESYKSSRSQTYDSKSSKSKTKTKPRKGRKDKRPAVAEVLVDTSRMSPFERTTSRQVYSPSTMPFRLNNSYISTVGYEPLVTVSENDYDDLSRYSIFGMGQIADEVNAIQERSIHEQYFRAEELNTAHNEGFNEGRAVGRAECGFMGERADRTRGLGVLSPGLIDHDDNDITSIMTSNRRSRLPPGPKVVYGTMTANYIPLLATRTVIPTVHTNRLNTINTLDVYLDSPYPTSPAHHSGALCDPRVARRVEDRLEEIDDTVKNIMFIQQENLRANALAMSSAGSNRRDGRDGRRFRRGSRDDRDDRDLDGIRIGRPNGGGPDTGGAGAGALFDGIPGNSSGDVAYGWPRERVFYDL